jgi:flagellin
MPLVLGSNLLASRVQLAMGRTEKEIRSALTRVATGSAVGPDGDTSGRLALADRLRTQTRVSSVALLNAQQGLSYVATTDAGLAEIDSILTRMAELASQGANTTLSTAQRSASQLEFSALGSEIERISATTTFNGQQLLSFGSGVTMQVGITSGVDSTISVGSIITTLETLGIGSAGGSLSYSIIDETSELSVSASLLAYSAILSAQDTLTTQRGAIGAATSRLSASVDLLSATRETLATAESTVRDADMAQEIMELTRLRVLQETQSALLAQANQVPALVLKLLE